MTRDLRIPNCLIQISPPLTLSSYIRYGEDSEELYDLRADPNEWTNLATRPEHDAPQSPDARVCAGNIRAPGTRFESAEVTFDIRDLHSFLCSWFPQLLLIWGLPRSVGRDMKRQKPFAYPSDLAVSVKKRLRAVQVPPRALSALEEIVEVAFFASMRTEESEQIPVDSSLC